MARLLVLLLLTAATIAAQILEGTVVNKTTGAPVDGARVMLNLGSRTVYETTTDGRGAFRVEGLKPGSYIPYIDKKGFIPAAVSLRMFQIVEGGQTVSLRAEMVPMGKVSGHVLDADGRPVKGAQVEMLASFGGPSVTTDADGNFSLTELVPATYTLSARPPRNAKAMELDGGRRVAWVMTYYPGVAQRSAATRLTIAPGTEIFGQDFRLIATPAHRIRGVALDHKGDPFAGVAIVLADPSRIAGEGDAQAHSGADGTFEFADVPTGEWRLSAIGTRDGVLEKSFQRVQIGDRDLDRVEMRLALPFAIQGTVIFEGAALPSLKNVGVLMGPVVGGEMVNGHADENGRFTIDGLYQGTYQFVPMPSPRFYLASIRLGERESTDGNIEFVSSELPLTIVYRFDGGTVRGTVEECGSATIVLVPQDLALRRKPYIQERKCGTNGAYEFTAIRPGEYNAIALNPSDAAFNFMSTDLNQGQLNAATHVTVRPNEATLVDLKVTR